MVDSLIRNPTSLGDNLCNICISFIKEYSQAFGMTYGETNILLFCVLMPTIIVLLFVSSITGIKSTIGRVAFWIALLIIIGIVASFILVIISIILDFRINM